MTADAPGRLADLPVAAAQPHPTAVAVFEALNRAGVRWCLLRGEARLQAPPHDVDLLVAADDFEAMKEAVRPLGFLSVPTWSRATHRFLVAHDAATPEWFLLDAVTALSYGPAYAIETGAAEACLARRERVHSLWLLCADDAFWTLLLHCLLDRGDVPAHQEERLRRLARTARADTSLARFTGDLCPPGWDAKRILAAIRTQGAAPLLGLTPALIRRWADRHPLRFRLRRLADKLRWRLAPLHKLVAMRGLRVVLLDEDGELAKRAAAGLPGKFYLPATVLDLGPWRGPGGALLRRAQGNLLAAYHRARGRLVVIALPSTVGAALDSWPRLRPDLLITLTREGADARVPAAPARSPVVACTVKADDEDLRRARGFVLHAIWQAYARERGWGPVPTIESPEASHANPPTASGR